MAETQTIEFRDPAARVEAGTSGSPGTSGSHMAPSPAPNDQLEDIQGEKMVLNMGPSHPATHGVLRVVLELDGEIITKAIP
ncbi:MAG: hypothetical protein ACXWC8_09070, partial [Limisphaerales bacterium]